MFKSHGDTLRMDAGHIDISYNNPSAWPALTPQGSIKAFIFNIGDEQAGPNVQLGRIEPMESEPLDWKHSIDPIHHHGSDQFRVVSGGDWDLAGRPMRKGGYAFQESGWVYQEHPGPSGGNWMLLLMGDRRGNQATLRLAKDKNTIFEYDEVYGAPKDDVAYPHPAGDKGIAAITTTAGVCERGYLLGRIEDVQSGTLSGVLGDPAVGPLVHVLKAGPNETVIPACTYSTELVLVVVAGSCKIGSASYSAGDLRIQAADAPLDALVSGSDGLKLALVVADRRARPVLSAAAAAPGWMADVDGLLNDLSPVPGGARAERQRAAAKATVDA